MAELGRGRALCFLDDTSTTWIYTLSLHDALPISTFKRPVSSWKALNLRKTLLMASSVRLKPTPLIMRSEERFSRNAETDLVCRLLLEKKNGSVSVFCFLWNHIYIFFFRAL